MHSLQALNTFVIILLHLAFIPVFSKPHSIRRKPLLLICLISLSKPRTLLRARSSQSALGQPEPYIALSTRDSVREE